MNERVNRVNYEVYPEVWGIVRYCEVFVSIKHVNKVIQELNRWMKESTVKCEVCGIYKNKTRR